MNFILQVYTPEGCFFDGETNSLLVPLASGKWQLLANHCPAEAIVKEGECRIGNDLFFVTNGGMVYFADNHCTLLCDIAATPKDWAEVRQQWETQTRNEDVRRKQSFAEHQLAKGALAKAFDQMKGKPKESEE